MKTSPAAKSALSSAPACERNKKRYEMEYFKRGNVMK
jgi:hypothetical protein